MFKILLCNTNSNSIFIKISLFTFADYHLVQIGQLQVQLGIVRLGLHHIIDNTKLREYQLTTVKSTNCLKLKYFITKSTSLVKCKTSFEMAIFI